MRVTRYLRGIDGTLIDVTQHSTPNDELCHDTSDSKSVPKNGQVQLRVHAPAAFASQSVGSMNYPFAMLFHIELAWDHQEYQIDDT